MIGRILTRRASPLGIALTAFDIYRRLPERQRKQLLRAARTHGPRVAAAAVARARIKRK